MTPTRADVVILGSGIAGGFLARHLSLHEPKLEVLCLEAADAITDYKVGESTVEISASYMTRRLELIPYLYGHQLPKNGLRFFFDSKEKDLAIDEMAELGSIQLPFHPSFQLERAALERDLVQMNRASGVRVELGAKVVDLSIDSAGHTVVWEQGGERHEASARWVVDATGRRHTLQRKLGRKVTKEERLPTAAAWGRYRNVKGLDAVKNPAWRERVRYTSRHLSTNHLMYDGYWIWFIPLAGDLMSVGVVYDKERLPDGPRTREEMEAFLGKHRAARDLMAGAVFEDFRSYAHLPFHSDAYFSTDRWALTGEAGAFTDPFYSPGSDFISTANELIVALISAETSGDRAAFERVTQLSNDYYRARYEANLALYVRQYATFGSFEVFRLKYRLDFHNYYNMLLWPFLAGRLTDPAWLESELKVQGLQLRAVRAFGEHLRQMSDALASRGAYHDQNRGIFVNGIEGVADLQYRISPELDDAHRQAEADRIHATIYLEIMERTLGVQGLLRPRVVSELTVAIILALRAMDEQALSRLLQRVSARLTRETREQFPDRGIERVSLEVVPAENGLRRVQVGVVGPGGDAQVEAAAFAERLWSVGATHSE